MKKLNNKGFTLVELLAVIIILAIVVGISIPAITNVINDSKNNAMGVAVDAAEKYVGDQYSLMAVDASLADADFKKLVTTYGTQTLKLYTTTSSDRDENTVKKHKAFIKAMGLAVEDVLYVQVKINSNDTVCVSIEQIPTNSKYYTTEYWGTNKKPKTKTVENADGTTSTVEIEGIQRKSKSC